VTAFHLPSRLLISEIKETMVAAVAAAAATSTKCDAIASRVEAMHTTELTDW